MRALIWLTTGIAPRQWAAVHRKHHKFADAEGDPHSPYVHGFWQIQLLNYFYYRREAANPDTIARFTRDMVDDGWDRLFSRTSLGVLLFAAILVVASGSGGAASQPCFVRTSSPPASSCARIVRKP